MRPLNVSYIKLGSSLHQFEDRAEQWRDNGDQVEVDTNILTEVPAK